MFTTVSSFWKPLAYPLFLVPDSDRKKGKTLIPLFSSFFYVIFYANHIFPGHSKRLFRLIYLSLSTQISNLRDYLGSRA